MRRAIVLLTVLAPALLAGCADEEPGPRTLPALRVRVTSGFLNTVAFGEILGSEEGSRIHPFRVDAPNSTFVADVPDGVRHLVAVAQSDRPAELLADVTRASVERNGSDYPAIVEFERVEHGFQVSVVQLDTCHATVDAAGSKSEGTGPFRPPVLRAGQTLDFTLDGARAECPQARFEFQALGEWAVRPPRRA